MVAFGYLNKNCVFKKLFAFKVIMHRCNHLKLRVKISNHFVELYELILKIGFRLYFFN